jgi:LacI family transcriptional regulator
MEGQATNADNNHGGRRRWTIKDVAARAGVSPATVSRVLGGTYPVARTTRSKVQRAMRELDYVVNAQARALKGATSKTVAFIVNDVTVARRQERERQYHRGADREDCPPHVVCLLLGSHDRAIRPLMTLMRKPAIRRFIRSQYLANSRIHPKLCTTWN